MTPIDKFYLNLIAVSCAKCVDTVFWIEDAVRPLMPQAFVGESFWLVRHCYPSTHLIYDPCTDIKGRNHPWLAPLRGF